MISREKLEHVVTTGMIEGKHSRRKQREMMLDGLTKWLKVELVTYPLKVTRDGDVGKIMNTLKSMTPD